MHTAPTHAAPVSLHDALPISDATRIAVGQTATVSVASLGSPVTGKVTALEVTSTVVNNVVTYAGTVTLDQAPSGARSGIDRKSTRLNSSHANISYAVFCLKKK